MRIPIPTRLCKIVFLASLTLPYPAFAESIAELYGRIQQQPNVGECVEVNVDVSGHPPVEKDKQLFYPMEFNDIAEGWSWQPESTPEHDDFFRFKYLPLGSFDEDRGDYQAEDLIGDRQTMHVHWRYDYFLAFDNPHEFYPRSPEEAMGFNSQLPVNSAMPTAMRANVCLEAPVTSESTTFWKATHGHPEDFTLKKRYLIGKLRSITFIDSRDGTILSTIKSHTPTTQ